MRVRRTTGVLIAVALVGLAPHALAEEPSGSLDRCSALAALGFACPGAPAPLQENDEAAKAKYSVEVMVVHATRIKNKKPDQKPIIDKRIGDLPQLLEEPFSLYDRFDWLGQDVLPLKKADPRSLQLPNGRTLRVALIQELKDAVRFSASINRPGGKDFLPLLSVKARPGKVFIVAGQKYKNGILVLVLRVKE